MKMDNYKVYDIDVESEHKAKNCPCCGGAAVVAPVAGSDECYVVCSDCSLSSDYYPSYEEAVKKWNTRPIEDEKDKEIESLKVELDNLRHFCDSILEMAKLNNGVLYFKQDSGIWKIETGKDNCSYRRLV